jgi:hypothetical protein
MPEGLTLEEASVQLTRELIQYAFHYPDEPSAIVDQDVDGYSIIGRNTASRSSPFFEP